MNQSYMKEHPVMKLLLTMSLPMMISMLVNSLYNIVDSFFVAKISEDAMTALSLVFPMQNLVNAVMVGFGIGINAMISFYMGANDRKMVDKAASQGMLLGTLHGVVLTVVCILFITPFLRMFTSSEQVVELGSSYSVIAFSFSVILAWELVFEKTFQAVGRMAVSMVCMMSGCIANIILDPLLIFGIGPFPLLGIQGAALATGLGQTISAVFYLIIYLTRPMSVHFHRKDAILDTTLCKKMYSIGIPATLNMALPSLLISALNMILAGFSQTYVFVLGVYYKLQTFLYLPANGVIQGMRPLIGYNYGAGEKKRVHQIFLQATGLVAMIMIIGTILCFAIPDALIGLFTSNADSIASGSHALRIICIGFIISSLSVTACGALEGLGKGLPSLFISLCRYVVLMIPMAWILSRIFGASGVWHAFWITETITVVISMFIYRRYSVK
ncbi:MAG: MATE family efflux transporter [Lachnospiraceae bacterium]